MKDIVQPAEHAAERSIEQEGFANRKLIRPSLNHSNHSAPIHSGPNHSGPSHLPQAAGERERRERPERSERSGDRSGDRSNGARKAPPPDQTNAENFYYQKQMQSKTPMVIVLADDEEIHGQIEWYDKACIKVNRVGAPNVVIYKPSIKYMFKEGEGK
jgi:sRNA-binding regulator protein Hfq